ncbi:MAG: hypothetical protein WAQ22_00445 [Candidatus Saccharimonas sp.]
MKRGKTTIGLMILVIVLVSVWIFRKVFTTHILGFLLTGALPGMSISLPYWAMLLGYSLTIFSIIVLISYRRIAEFYSTHIIVERKRRLPRRRYSQI